MIKITRALLWLLSLYPLLPAMPAYCSDYHLGMDMGGSYSSHVDYLDRGTLGLVDQLHFSSDRSYTLMRAEPFFSFTLQEGVGGYVQADIDWENSDDDYYKSLLNEKADPAMRFSMGLGASF